MSARYYANGPVQSILSRDCLTFWNADVGGAGPWNLSIDVGAAAEVTGFEYSIFEAPDAPRNFRLEMSVDNLTWVTVGQWQNATNDGCMGPTRTVNASKYLDEVIALSQFPSGSGVTNFALCYLGFLS